MRYFFVLSYFNVAEANIEMLLAGCGEDQKGHGYLPATGGNFLGLRQLNNVVSACSDIVPPTSPFIIHSSFKSIAIYSLTLLVPVCLLTLYEVDVCALWVAQPTLWVAH